MRGRFHAPIMCRPLRVHSVWKGVFAETCANGKLRQARVLSTHYLTFTMLGQRP